MKKGTLLALYFTTWYIPKVSNEHHSEASDLELENIYVIFSEMYFVKFHRIVLV